jgi:D-serine dehydratase
MRSTKLLSVIAVVVLVSAISASAQMEKGMMGGAVPEEIAKMMQEQNKALAQVSMQYMTVFTHSLHVQSKERREQIDANFITTAFSEMKRAYGMIEKFQSAHVKTMDDRMQARVKPMMERMNSNLALIRNNLDDLEREVGGSRNLDKISFLTGEILKHLEDLPKGPGGMQGMTGGKQPMMK